MLEQLVYVRSTYSRLHVAVERDGVLVPPEACDLADLDPSSRELVYSLADVDSYELCGRCFPHFAVQGTEGTVTS